MIPAILLSIVYQPIAAAPAVRMDDTADGALQNVGPYMEQARFKTGTNTLATETPGQDRGIGRSP